MCRFCEGYTESLEQSPSFGIIEQVFPSNIWAHRVIVMLFRNADVKDQKFISVNEKIVNAYNALIKDLRSLVDTKFKNKHQ